MVPTWRQVAFRSEIVAGAALVTTGVADLGG